MIGYYLNEQLTKEQAEHILDGLRRYPPEIENISVFIDLISDLKGVINEN